MVQPNKVDFDVRKLLKRKKASRDCMALSGHGQFCITRCKIPSDVCFMRLFAAKITPLGLGLGLGLGPGLVIDNSRDSITNNESNTNIKKKQSHLGLLAASQRPHN
jgi:hypothetical protein